MPINPIANLPPQDVQGVYALCALAADPVTSKKRLQELVKATDEAQSAIDELTNARQAADKKMKEVEGLEKKLQTAFDEKAKEQQAHELKIQAREEQLALSTRALIARETAAAEEERSRREAIAEHGKRLAEVEKREAELTGKLVDIEVREREIAALKHDLAEKLAKLRTIAA